MRKNKIFALSVLSLLTFGVTSCTGNNGNSNNNNESGEATIKILNFEHGSAVSSFTDNKGKVGEAGYLTITPENKNYHVDYVYQNDIFNLKNDPTDPYKYLFTLKEGENVFEISMYYEEVETSASEIIAPDNETVTVGGTLSDDLDDIPTIDMTEEEEAPVENPLKIYFKDASWWNSGMAGVGLITYDKDKKPLTENTELGDQMKWMEYNAAGGFNYWTRTIDKVKTSFVQFIRTDGSCTTDWGARTDILPVPTETLDMYEVTTTATWYNDSGYAAATNKKYDPSNDPVFEDRGIYSIYFEAKKWWTDKGSDTKIYMFGLENQAWPGTAMSIHKENEDGSIIYFATLDTSKYNKCIFNVSGGSFQTADLDVPSTYGKDAKLLAKLPDNAADSKSFSVTWSEYSE